MTHEDPILDGFINDLWRDLAGLPPLVPRAIPDLGILKQTEWSLEFERLMRNRLIMGAIRYGRINEPGKPAYDRIGSIIRRAKQYLESGNDELLVDIANIALLEFEEGTHPISISNPSWTTIAPVSTEAGITPLHPSEQDQGL